MDSHGGAPGAEDADDGVRGVGFEFYGECMGGAVGGAVC